MAYRYILVLMCATQFLSGMEETRKEKTQVKRDARDVVLICQDCSLNADNDFSDEAALAQHQYKVHANKVVCDSLKKQKNSKSWLLSCKLCKKEVDCAPHKEAPRSDQEAITLHLQREHNFCNNCDKECPQGITLFAHIKAAHPVKLNLIKDTK